MSGRVGVEQTPDIEALTPHVLAALREGWRDDNYSARSVAEHVAQALAPVLAAAVREARAAAWDECAKEACDLGWMHEHGEQDVLARNPYRADRIAADAPEGGAQPNSPLVVHRVSPGTWTVQEKVVPGFRLSKSTTAPLTPVDRSGESEEIGGDPCGELSPGDEDLPLAVEVEPDIDWSDTWPDLLLDDGREGDDR